MNVLALYSSPRRNSNSTFLLKEIMSAVKEKGVHTTTEFDVAKMNIKGCQACEGCHNPKGNGGCVVKDDMQQVLAAVKQADYIFMSTPLYWWNISAQLKAVFDRFYSLNKKNDLQGKTIHLVITGASEEDDIGYELVNKTFMEICDYIGCEFKILIVSGDDSNPAQKNEKAIAQAKAIGESL
ncbi:flavodoxin family protein [Youxingia wuxianensis]|uniref:Flavodoxin family protein n=1 Tax=Youxingia wuxianensis TaxID=2763678 RepID=A0A926ESX9_9FIRM|nr:flavodoxin family protein [Youxingia wuxianensis]MBC8586027.1 flavodoxin family protein [Youxingia wuxianensis]